MNRSAWVLLAAALVMGVVIAFVTLSDDGFTAVQMVLIGLGVGLAAGVWVLVKRRAGRGALEAGQALRRRG